METIEKIKLAQKTRGVIIFTDPDFPGTKIRQTITEHVPDCKHAFIPKELAKDKLGRGVGVEHASPETIRQALKDARMMTEEVEENITREDLLEAGLIGGADARQRREKLGKILKIGYANGKQLHKRLMMFQITRTDFFRALEILREEEKE